MQLPRHLPEPHQLALLAVRSEVGADQLGLDQDGRELAAVRVEIADRLDLRPASSQLDAARRLGARRVLERAQVRDDAPLLPVHATGRRDLGRRLLAIAEAPQRAAQIDAAPGRARP